MLRPGCIGCATVGKPVPSHAGQSTSFDLGPFNNARLFGRRDDGLVHHRAHVIRISFSSDQETLLKK